MTALSNPKMKEAYFMEFQRLFQPIRIHALDIPNRIVMPAMGLAYTRDYTFNDRYEAFYMERARGGVGLLVIGPLAVDRVGSVPLMLSLAEEEAIPPLKGLIRRIHAETETRVGAQLMHMGRYAFSWLTGVPAVAPSPVPSQLTRETPREMTEEDILTVQEAYVRAALHAREAGFDLIEILACTGYLISQFLSPVTNRRTDAYGGPLQNRMRFGLEVIAKVREAVGPDMCLSVRVAGHDYMPGGHTNVESAAFAAAAEAAGVDAVNVTGGWHETYVPQLTGNVPAGAYLYLARGIKEHVGVPVFASNRLGDPVVAERALRSGVCDMICWGRPLITDPELPLKVRQGRLKEIVSCISCNQGCFDAIFSASPVTCILNPRAGREGEPAPRPAASPRRILVAGGGPAGMAFALTAAARGHRVTLQERERVLGGQVNLASVPPGKGEFRKAVESLRNRLEHAGVRVGSGAPVTRETLSTDPPDLLVIATGALPVTPEVPGIRAPHVVQAWDVLAEKVPEIGKHVIVIGGGATGCETALAIARMGTLDAESFTFLMHHGAERSEDTIPLLDRSLRTVTLLDMLPRFADAVGRTARWSLLKDLKLAGVTLRPGTRLLEVTDKGVWVEGKEGREHLPADTVVLALGVSPCRTLEEDALVLGIPSLTLGDARAPRNLTEAIREGMEAGMET